MRTEAWPAALIFFLIGSVSILSILFPQWDIRWGRTGSFRPHKNRPPVSNTGKALFGAMGLCGALAALASNKIAYCVCFAVFVGLLIAQFPVYLRDKEEFDSRNSQN
jgi:hypothetical protein